MEHKEFGGIILSTSCTNRCLFCRDVPKVSAEELKKQEEKVAKNLEEFKKKGIKKIEISGNDPIEYGPITHLIKRIKEIGFEYVQLSTHGKRIADEDFCNELISSGLDKLRIPLYGSNAKIHDSVTQTKGSFNLTFKGIRNILEKGKKIEIQISTLIVQQNKYDMKFLVSMLNDIGIRDFYISIPCVANNDYSYYVPIKELPQVVRPVFEHSIKINFPVNFMEIPYCVFGESASNINNIRHGLTHRHR